MSTNIGHSDGSSDPPTEEINVSGRQADRLTEEFSTKVELIDYLRDGGDISDFSGLGGTTARRVNNWFEEEHPAAHRARIENDEGIATEFYERDDQDHEEYRWGYICPRCGAECDCKGDPAGFRGRPYECHRCHWVALLHADPLTEFINRVVEADSPEWLPESYDPDDDLWDRVDAIDEIDGAVEVHALGVDGSRIILGEPHDVTEADGRRKLCAGGKPHCWTYEATIYPGDDEDHYLHSIDMAGDAEENSRDMVMSGDFDLRLYKVDAPEMSEDEKDEKGEL
jgi:hypothetical protein